MKIKFNKYQGTGNDFVIADNRNQLIKLSSDMVKNLCDRRFGIGADGLILIESSESADFYMRYYNADGNESTMCGNGGRCAAHYSAAHGIAPAQAMSFMAADGMHRATVMKSFVEITLRNPEIYNTEKERCYLNTGSPHLVVFVTDPASVDVESEGSLLRYSQKYAPDGTNVNFAARKGDKLHVRTYERGVEAETLSCGTGVTASAIAALLTGQFDRSEKNKIEVITPGGTLLVSFCLQNGIATEVKLSGEATFVFSGTTCPL